jgi:hypothetical protein
MTIGKSSLEAQIAGRVVVPGDEEYDTLLRRWAGNAEKPAAFIAVVKSAEDISKTVITLTFSLTQLIWATKNKLDLAIRGGGHSASGASSSDGGVVGAASIYRPANLSRFIRPALRPR